MSFSTQTRASSWTVLKLTNPPSTPGQVRTQSESEQSVVKIIFPSPDCHQETEVLVSRPRRDVSQSDSEDLRDLRETVQQLREKIDRLEEQLEEQETM